VKTIPVVYAAPERVGFGWLVICMSAELAMTKNPGADEEDDGPIVADVERLAMTHTPGLFPDV